MGKKFKIGDRVKVTGWIAVATIVGFWKDGDVRVEFRPGATVYAVKPQDLEKVTQDEVQLTDKERK